MYPTNSLQNLFKLFIGFILILFVWVLLGFRTTNIIGLNDISHHLLTLSIGNQKNPFFSPIYDWLWMGGQLVAPNVGNIPIERFLLFLGLSTANTLSLTILFFQTAIFYFCTLILDEENQSKTTTIICSLSLAFLPTISLRIIYGHLSLFIPVLFNLIFIWILISRKKSLFSILFSLFIFLHLFSGPYFQIIFYSILLTWPVLIYFNFDSFKKNIFFFSWIFISALLLNLDYVLLIFNYFTSGDLFRDSNSSNLIYSYAKLKLENFVDLLTYDFINLEDLPFYFAHEIKAFIGILPLIFLVSKRLSFKKYFVFYLFLGFYFFFVFCPPSLEFLFYKIPFLNMFRIPQRLVLCIVLPIYLLIFKNKSEQPDSKIAFSILVVISALFIGLYSLTLLDFFFFFVSLLFIFPIKKASISLKTMGLIFLISNFFFLYHHPQKTSPKLVLDYTSNTQGILRSKIYNSNFWTTNTNRFVSSNSIYGYTHPLPKYRELFTKTFNVNVIDLLYFKDLPGHPLNDNFQSLYRYFSDSTLSYSPTNITNDINVFWNEFKKDKSPVAAGELAYSDVNISLIKQSLCSNQLSISNESIDNRNVFSLNVFNNFNEDCLIVIPFNFSHFLNVKNNELKSKIVPINISQIGTIVHPGKNHLVFYTNDSLYWNLKFMGFVLGLISFFTHYYYRRRYLL